MISFPLKDIYYKWGKRFSNRTLTTTSTVKDDTHEAFWICNGSDGAKMCLSIALFGLRQSTTAPWGMTSKSKQGTSPTICSEADIFSLAQKLSLDPKLLYRAAHSNGCPTVFNKHRKKHEGRSREAHSSLNSPQKQNHRNVFRYTVW